jgi:hypothetical protein
MDSNLPCLGDGSYLFLGGERFSGALNMLEPIRIPSLGIIPKLVEIAGIPWLPSFETTEFITVYLN